jgi:hypothetical protein
MTMHRDHRGRCQRCLKIRATGMTPRRDCDVEPLKGAGGESRKSLSLSTSRPKRM